MARIAGVDLPGDKRVEIALTAIYGVGRSTSRSLIEDTGLDPDARMRDLTEGEIAQLRDAIEKNHPPRRMMMTIASTADASVTSAAPSASPCW